MKNVMGIINVSRRDELLKDLTSLRCIASVPFGGRYRLIDFVLSGMVNSGIYNVGVFTLNKYRSLMDHLGFGKEWDLNRKRDGLFILPPPIHYPFGYYRGDLQNFFSHIDYFHRSTQEYVIITGSNIVCNINFNEAFQAHQESGADITVLYKEIAEQEEKNFEQCRRIVTGDDGQVLDMEDKPGRLKSNKVLMEMFIMKKSLFIEIIENSNKMEYSNLIRDGLIQNVNRLNIFGFHYAGYLGIINSVKNFYKHSMDLLKREVWQELFYKPGLIYTKVKDEPPTKYLEQARVTNSLISNGCLIEGRVENSILSRGVKVHRGACITNSIVMQRNEIGKNARIENTILDKEALVSEGKELIGTPGQPLLMGKKSIT